MFIFEIVAAIVIISGVIVYSLDKEFKTETVRADSEKYSQAYFWNKLWAMVNGNLAIEYDTER